MRVTITKDNKKKLILEGTKMAIQAPSSGDPLMILAEFDQASPIKIVVDGNEPVGVRRMALVHKKTYRVDAFIRHTKNGSCKVPAHDRRFPVRNLRKEHKSI